MGPSYATGHRVLEEAASLAGARPTTLLDFGAGPGTMTWAAKQLWPGLQLAHLVEPSKPLVDAAQYLLHQVGVVKCCQRPLGQPCPPALFQSVFQPGSRQGLLCASLPHSLSRSRPQSLHPPSYAPLLITTQQSCHAASRSPGPG